MTKIIIPVPNGHRSIYLNVKTLFVLTTTNVNCHIVFHSSTHVIAGETALVEMMNKAVLPGIAQVCSNAKAQQRVYITMMYQMVRQIVLKAMMNISRTCLLAQCTVIV